MVRRHSRPSRFAALARALSLSAAAAVVFGGAATAIPQQPRAAEGQARPARTEAPGPSLPESWVSAFDWRCIGPANMGGRITAISVHEKDPSIWYAATASGGLLKTTNNGITLEHQFDKETTVSIGDVAVSQTDPNIVWVGTGEQNPRNSVSWGDGVYKSVDGGKTWKNMGLKQGFQTGRVVIHPTDANTVYVGVMGRLWGPSDERGLYKTTNGGESWERILFVDDKTGVIDIQLKPGEPDTILAATYERQRDGFDTNEPAKRNGPGSGLWKSTDAGKTWARLYNGLPEGNLGRMGIEFYRKDPATVYLVVESDRTGTEPPDAPYVGLRGADAEMGARITDVTKDGPAEAAGLKAEDIVIKVNDATVHSYANFLREVRKRVAGETVKVEVSRERKSHVVDVTLAKRPEPATRQRARDGTGRRTDDTGGAGPFSSGLGGQRGNLTEQQGPDGHHYGGLYKSTDTGETWTRINSLNPRPMYFSKVYADPSDDNHLWCMGVSLARSKDNGKEFTDDGGRGTHADGHALWINPSDGRHMIYGNDGGIYVTYDRGESWDHLNHVAIGQFYHVAVDTRSNYMVYGGLQDNGSWGGPSRARSGSGPINEDWISVGGGDGFVCRVDPNDPDQVYYESQGGAMGRFNFRTGERGSIRPQAERGTRYRFNWKTPFVLSAHNPRIFYAAAQFVFRSVDQGRTMKRISDEFTRTPRGSGTAVAESPRDSDVLYVGSDDGALLATRNGGRTWTKLVDFPLTDEERTAQAQVEESESGGGAAGSPAEPPPPAAEAPAAEPPAPQAPEQRAADPAASPESPAPADAPARPAAGGRSGFGERMLERWRQADADKDGKITRAEVPEQLASLFDRADANADGAIDEEELKTLPQRLGTRGPGGGAAATGRAGPTRRSQPESAPPSEQTRTGGDILPPEPIPAPPARRESTPPKEAAADDPITGVWSAKPTGETPFAGGGDFSFSLTLAGEGKVSGSYDSPRGDGTITDGKFDAAKAEFSAGIETERAPMELRAKLVDGKLKGAVEMAGGRFSLEFEASRTSRTPADPAVREAAAAPGKALSELLPGPRWVSSIEASRFRAGRVYVTFDGHRSNDDEPYAFVSEDYGRSWRSIRADLPTSAGSTKVIREDPVNENLLFLGTEFGAYASIDRGRSWTRFNNNLPTVAVHEFAFPVTGEIVAGTHGRSIWITDITPLRQLTDSSAQQAGALYAPRTAHYWRPQPRRGGDNRRFVGSNDPSGAAIVYSLARRARSITLQVTDAAGEVIRELEPKADPGLHKVTWDLRRQPDPGRVTAAGTPAGRAAPAAGGGGGGGFGGGFRGGARPLPAGAYRVVLKVDGEVFSRPLTIEGDPEFPDYQPWAVEEWELDIHDELRPRTRHVQPLDRDD